MKRILFLAAVLAASAYGQAGRVQQSIYQLGTTNTWVLAFNWTGAGSTGAVPNTTGLLATCCQGYNVSVVETVPGTPAPTGGYNVAITDGAGVDVLGSSAVGLSATSAQSFQASPAATPIQGSLTLVITGQAVSAAKGVVYVFMNKPGTINALNFGRNPNTAPTGYILDANNLNTGLAYPTLSSACTAANAVSATLFVSLRWNALNTQSLNCSLFFLADGVIQPGSGQIITFTAQSAPLATICDVSIGGHCTINGPAGEVFIQWWSAVCDDSSNATAGIAEAFRSIHIARQAINIGYGTCRTDPITALSTDDVLVGNGSGVSFLKSRTGGDIIARTITGEVDRTHIHDIGFVGTGSGAGKGISLVSTVSSSSNDWHDLNFITIGGTCIYFPLGFSNHFHDISGACGAGGAGNFFDIASGNTTSLDNNYCYFIGTGNASGSSGVCYRIHNGYVNLTNLNGMNGGVNATWGVFGDNMAEDGTVGFVQANIINPNIESFTNTGMRFKSGSSLQTLTGGKIEAPATGTVMAMLFDHVVHAGIIDGTILVTDGAAWANSEPIHADSPPFFNIDTGVALTAYTGAASINIPTLNPVYDGNLKYSWQFDRVRLPAVYTFALGTRGNSTIAPITQTYDSNCTPTDGLAHLRGEVAWNPNAALNGPAGCICISAGTPGTWAIFGGAVGPIASGYLTVLQDVKIIANGVNGCATAAGCWQVNGLLGDGLAASTGQSGIYFASPIGAGVYVRDIRIKSVTACTGTSTATLGIGTSANATYYLPAATYDIKAAVSDSNIWPSTGQGLGITASTNIGALSDSSTTIGVIVNTTGGNVNALAVGCEFKVWVGYWIAQ